MKVTKLRKSQIYIVLYSLSLLILLLVFGKDIYITKSIISYTTQMNPVAVGEILADTVVEQSFVADTNSIDTISIKFATYQRINTAKVEVELWNAQKKQKIEQWEFSAEESFPVYISGAK